MDAVQSAVILSADRSGAANTAHLCPRANRHQCRRSELRTFGLRSFSPSSDRIQSVACPSRRASKLSGMTIQNHLITHPAAVFPAIATAALTAPAPAETSPGRHAGVDAPPVAGEALPLMVVLWDLPASRSIEKAVTHEVNAAPAAPTVNMAPAGSSVSGCYLQIGVGQSAQRKHAGCSGSQDQLSSGTQSVMDAQTASDVGQLSKALLNAIKDSTHTKIEVLTGEPHDLRGRSHERIGREQRSSRWPASLSPRLGFLVGVPGRGCGANQLYSRERPSQHRADQK